MTNPSTAPATFDPCLQCKKQIVTSYFRIPRVRGHFCSRDCAKAFLKEHPLPPRPLPRCWECDGECNGDHVWRIRSIRGSRFCSLSCTEAYDKELKGFLPR